MNHSTLRWQLQLKSPAQKSVDCKSPLRRRQEPRYRGVSMKKEQGWKKKKADEILCSKKEFFSSNKISCKGPIKIHASFYWPKNVPNICTNIDMPLGPKQLSSLSFTGALSFLCFFYQIGYIVPYTRFQKKTRPV